MISVEQALEAVFALVDTLPPETVDLAQAAGRVLAAPVEARRAQPPFASSAMDGYAVRNAEVAAGARFDVIGEAAAGHAFAGPVGPGQAVRIFTGAPVPEGADRILIQEDVDRDETGHHTRITLRDGFDTATYLRPAGGDFDIGARIEAPRRLSATDLALIAAMNHPTVQVARRPQVALIATGDELVMPGESPSPDQIIASNTFGLKALLEAEGATARMLPIARDNRASLEMAFKLARGADLVVTIGGASVGDHDLVGRVAGEQGMEQSFYKVAMRPGKPLMAGRLAGAPMIGLPGNPVSSMVCGLVFLLPVIRAMQGLPRRPLDRQLMALSAPLSANGGREHYMRAALNHDGPDSAPAVAALDRQDSNLLSVLARSDALIVRPVGDPARAVGDLVPVIAPAALR